MQGDIDIITLALAKKFTKESLLGGGAIVGKNVIISNIEPIDGGNRVTFSYTLDNGTPKTSTLDVMNGKDGTDAVTPEAIQEAVDKYLSDNPVQAGATEEQVKQIEQNTAEINEIKKESENYITGEDFPSYAEVYGLLNESEVE